MRNVFYLSLLTLLLPANNLISNKVNVIANDVTYDIHPIVHEINYGDDFVTLPNKIELSIDNEISSRYIAEEAYEVIGLKPILMNTGDDFSDFELIIETYNGTDEHFDKLDAYTVDINSSHIKIVGQNERACFYGLQTLREIFSQSNNQIRELSIKDYANSLYRGVIEGLYGTTWNHFEIMDMIDLIADYKGNSFFYGPRHDSYFRTEWRELLPEDEVTMLKGIVAYANSKYVDYYFGLNPVETKSFDSSNYEVDLQAFLARFEQAYEAGVRHFFISCDDVNGATVEADLQIRILNDLAAYARSKGDVGRIAFTPSFYCRDGETILGVTGNYLGTFKEQLDEMVDIFWTGEKITSCISTGAFDYFYERTGRKPIFWLNWPVNDYASQRIIMSKGEMLDVNYDDEDAPFLGVISNPQVLAYPSYLGIYQCLDYSWNYHDFDLDNVYDSFFTRYEENEPEALKQVCSYLANATAYFTTRYFEESPNLVPLINEYKEKKQIKEDLTAVKGKIVDELEYTIECVDKLLSNGRNHNLIEQLKPYMLAVKDTCIATEKYFDLEEIIKTKDNEQILSSLEIASNAFDKIDDNQAYVLDYVTNGDILMPAEVCNAVLTPFLNELITTVDYEARLITGLPTGMMYEGFEGIYSGDESLIFDNNENTYVWFQGHAVPDSFIQIDLGTIVDVSSLKVVYQDGNNSSACYMPDIEISTDGYEYTHFANQTSNILELDLRNDVTQIRFIRFANRGEYLYWWPSLAEVEVNYIDDDELFISTSGIKGIYEGTTSYMFDYNKDSYCWFDDYPATDAYIEFDYRKNTTLEKLEVIFKDGNDGPAFMPLIECSINGLDFFPLVDVIDNYVLLELDSPIEFRYLRFTNNCGEVLPRWVGIAEVTINPVDPVVTISGIKGVYSGEYKDMFDRNVDTYVWFDDFPDTDAYILVDFVKSRTTKKLEIIYQNAYPTSPAFMPLMEYSLDGVTYYKLGETESNIFTYSGEEITFRYLKMSNDWGTPLTHWASIADINFN